MDRTDTVGQLKSIPNLAAEVWLTKGAKNPSDRPLVASRSPFPKVPADLGVIDCLTRDERDGALLFELSRAVRAVWEDIDPKPSLTNPPTWSSETQWLLDRAEVWQADPRLSEYVSDQVWMVWRTLAREARVPEPLSINCPEPGCQGRLVESAGGWLTCTDCARQYPGRQRIVSWAQKASPMTTDELARMLPITPQMLTNWQRRKGLHPVNPGGRPLLWIPWDVIRLSRPDIVEAMANCDSAA